jgi:cytidyltransferase-like protein
LKDKRILAEVFALGITAAKVGQRALSSRLDAGPAELAEAVSSLKARRLVEEKKGSLVLTQEGRARLRVVFMGGGFEVIHPGHLHTIEQAKALGDVLVVVIARDSTIRRRKRREPISNEKERLSLVSSLRQVDAAILGVEGVIYETLEKVGPDVVALGYDQHHLEEDIEREALRRGMKLRVVRLKPADTQVKTSKLIAELS